MIASELQDARTSVIEFITKLKENDEKVRVDNFVRFSSIYSTVHEALTGTEPFNTRVRRAFNRHAKIAAVDNRTTYYASTIATTTALELDPTHDWAI